MLKDIRRILIIVCLVILIPWIVNSIPLKYTWDYEFSEEEKRGKIITLNVNKSGFLDEEEFLVREIIITDEATYLRYAIKSKEVGWSFPAGAIKIFDDKGREYKKHGGSSTGRSWGAEGEMLINRIYDDVEVLTLKLDWFDRRMEMDIPIVKVGASGE